MIGASAWGYWSTTATATGSATTGTLNPPTGVLAISTSGSSTANVSWTAPSGGSAPQGYYVTRTRTGDSSTAAACGTSTSQLATALSCADLSVPDGTYTYRVTAVLHSWTAASSASGSVTVASTIATTTTLASDSNPSVVGQTVTYTASVAPSTGTSTPTGSVTFKDGPTPICTAVALSSGRATCTQTYASVGSHSITADYAAGSGYGASSSTTLTQDVNRESQTIAFTSTAPANATVGGPTYAVSATGGPSGNPVTFSSGSPAVCSVTGSTVSFSTAGTCVVDADQAGSVDYAAAPRKQQSFNVGKGTQTIAFASTAPTTAKVGGTTYTVSATGGASGNPVTFSSGASSVCTVTGSTVSFVAVGTCVVNADQAGGTNYDAAAQAQQNIAVGPGNQAINFTSMAPTNAQVGGATYTATATGGASGNPVTFSVDPGASAVCTVSGSTVSLVSAGTCTINANQAGNTNYNAAPQVQQSFTVAKGNQTITFTSSAPSNATVGGSTYPVTATATSGLAVSLSSATTAVCTVSGSTVSFVGAGACTINANQAGNTNYIAAPQVQQSFTVAKGNQTITISPTAPTNATVGGNTYAVTATSSSGLAVTLTSATTAVCTVSGSTVSFVGAGACTINANQAGNTNYIAAPQVQQSFTVAKGNQTITFTSTAPTNATVGGNTYAVTATSSSGLAVTLTSATTAVCTVSGSTVSFVSAGACTITANQAGNADYMAATAVQQSFTVEQPLTTAPTNIQVSPGTGNTVIGSWTAVPRASSYECQT